MPEWLPGAKFKTQAKEWSRFPLEMLNKPFAATKSAMVRIFISGLDHSIADYYLYLFKARGVQSSSFSSSRLGDLNEGQDVAEQEVIIKQTAGSMYAGKSVVLLRILGLSRFNLSWHLPL